MACEVVGKECGHEGPAHNKMEADALLFPCMILIRHWQPECGGSF